MFHVSLDTSTINTARDVWFFNETDAIATYGHISIWNTTAVTTFNLVNSYHGGSFFEKGLFNEDIGCWSTGKVTSMGYMFNRASVFNQYIGSWNTAKVKTMNGLFRQAPAFNQDIGSWNTASVTNMYNLFYYAFAFNQDIGSWNTASVTNMRSVFYYATTFNQDIGAWLTTNVTTMNTMFYSAFAFNQAIGSWNTAKVTTTSLMFGDSAFNAYCPHVAALCAWGKTNTQLGITGSCDEITHCAPTKKINSPSASPTAITSLIP